MSWLSPAQHESKQKEILKKRCGGTGQWFLDGSEFKMWKGNREAFSTIWCHGIRGLHLHRFGTQELIVTSGIGEVYSNVGTPFQLSGSWT